MIRSPAPPRFTRGRSLAILASLVASAIIAGAPFPAAHAAGASTVGTTTDAYGLGYSADGYTCGASGRFWVFYNDGTNWGWKSSADGQTWSAWSVISSSVPPPPGGTNGLAIACSGNDVYYAGGEQSLAENRFFYNSGVMNAGGTISWSGEASQATSQYADGYPSIALDSAGNPWVAIQTQDGSGHSFIEVYKGGTGWALSHTFSFTSPSSPFPQIVGLTGGKMALLYGQPVSASPLTVAAFDGSTWTVGPSSPDASYQFLYSAAAANGDTVGACATDLTSVYLLSYAFGAASWSARTALGTGKSCSVVTDGTSLIGVFSVASSTTLTYRQSNDGGATFGSPSTLSSGEAGVNAVGASLQVSQDPAKQAMAVWLSNSPSANSVRFANIVTASVISEQVTITPSNGGPTGYASVSGCHASVASIPMDGSPHVFGADPSCALTFDVPADTPYTRYRFPGTSSAWAYTTGSGSSESRGNAVYYQFSATASYSVSGGGAPAPPPLSSTQTGAPFSTTLTGTPTVYWLDSGAPWSVPSAITDGVSTWQAAPSSGTMAGPTIMTFVYSKGTGTTTTVTTTSTTTSTTTVTSTSTSTTTSSTTITSTTTVTTTAPGPSGVPTASFLTCDQTSPRVNQRVNCTDLVSTADQGVPVGSVSWATSGAGSFARQNCNVKGGNEQLQCQVQYTPSGSGVQTLTATYSGDPYHAPSSGSAVLFAGSTGSSKATALSLSCDQAYVRLGQSTNCEATVNTADGGKASGTVTWGASDLGTFSHVRCQAPDRYGELVCDARYTPSAVGAPVVTATYVGDASHLSSAGSFEVFAEGGNWPGQQASFFVSVGAILVGGVSMVAIDARRGAQRKERGS